MCRTYSLHTIAYPFPLILPFCADPSCTKPGKAGWDDPSHHCELNEYCTDSGRCELITKSPFYKKACPYETGTKEEHDKLNEKTLHRNTCVANQLSTLTGYLPSFCGGGLRCYRHECLPCLNGMVDYSDGAVLVGRSLFTLFLPSTSANLSIAHLFR